MNKELIEKIRKCESLVDLFRMKDEIIKALEGKGKKGVGG